MHFTQVNSTVELMKHGTWGFGTYVQCFIQIIQTFLPLSLDNEDLITDLMKMIMR